MSKEIYNVTRGDALMLYATLMGSYTIRLKLRLDKPIDKDALRKAADKASERYPYLCVTLRKNEKEVYFEQNDMPVAIINSLAGITLNSPETNGHIWALCYEGCDLCIDFYHGRMDGTGVYFLLTTLLYYYFSEIYGEMDSTGIRTLNDPVTEKETADPLDALPVIDLSALPKQESPSALNLIKSFGLTNYGGVGQMLKIKIPERSFIPFTKANDSSPGIMISVFMARAIDKLHPGHTDPLLSNYVVNSRPMLGNPQTFHNCTTGVTLHYDDRIGKMPLETQCTVYRGKTFVQSDEDRVRQAMTVSGSVGKMILDLPTIEMKTQTAMQITGSFYNSSTYMVSYVGKWQYPQLGQHIKEFWTSTPVGPFPLIEIAAVNGEIFVSMMQSFSEHLYYDAFLDELRSNNIEFTECGAEPVITAKISAIESM